MRDDRQVVSPGNSIGDLGRETWCKVRRMRAERQNEYKQGKQPCRAVGGGSVRWRIPFHRASRRQTFYTIMAMGRHLKWRCGQAQNRDDERFC